MPRFMRPDEIKQLAKSRGHDLGDLLRRIGTHPSTFSRWQKAGQVYSIEAYLRLLGEIDKPPRIKPPRRPRRWAKKLAPEISAS